MTEYRKAVLRTANDNLSPGDRLINGALGLAGETGEFVDAVKKIAYHGKEFDRQKLLDELGDVRWYLELLADAIGITTEELEDRNVAKLRARYPDGFVKGGGIR